MPVPADLTSYSSFGKTGLKNGHYMHASGSAMYAFFAICSPHDHQGCTPLADHPAQSVSTHDAQLRWFYLSIYKAHSQQTLCVYEHMCLCEHLCTYRPAGLERSPPPATTRMPIFEGELVALDAFDEGAIRWLIPDGPLALHTQVRPMAFDAQLQSTISQHV